MKKSNKVVPAVSKADENVADFDPAQEAEDLINTLDSMRAKRDEKANEAIERFKSDLDDFIRVSVSPDYVAHIVTGIHALTGNNVTYTVNAILKYAADTAISVHKEVIDFKESIEDQPLDVWKDEIEKRMSNDFAQNWDTDINHLLYWGEIDNVFKDMHSAYDRIVEFNETTSREINQTMNKLRDLVHRFDLDDDYINRGCTVNSVK